MTDVAKTDIADGFVEIGVVVEAVVDLLDFDIDSCVVASNFLSPCMRATVVVLDSLNLMWVSLLKSLTLRMKIMTNKGTMTGVVKMAIYICYLIINH